MSTNSYLTTAELTIDLEPENEQVETPTGPPKLSQRGFSKPEYRPITAESLQIDVPDSIILADLTSDAQDLLENYLDIEQVGTMVNWEAIGVELGLSMDSLVALERNGKTRGVLTKSRNVPLTKLIKALVLHKRIDILFSLHELFKEEKLLLQYKRRRIEEPDCSTYSTASTELANDAKNIEKNSILVVSYTTKNKELKEIGWLVANLKSDKFNKSLKPVYSLHEIVSECNIEESISRAFEQAEHVIFCFTKELIDLKNQSRHESLEARSASHILRLSEQEFWHNNHKNKRFRAVTLYRFPVDLSTIGWAASTISYSFPKRVETLFKRLGFVF